jgi:hypothetical protein
MSEISKKGIIVLEFGSSVLRPRADLLNAVHEIHRRYRCRYGVLAMVSKIRREFAGAAAPLSGA